jgi:hypothetical protein
MKPSKLPSAERVRELLDYDPETGVLRWRATGKEAGYVHPSGYRIVKIDGICTGSHRLAWCWMTGAYPQEELDHINIDKADNRWRNLREATRVQNCNNRPLRRDNALGIKGVRREGSGFRARITTNGKLRSLGTFATEAEAAAAYCRAAQELHGEFSHAG